MRFSGRAVRVGQAMRSEHVDCVMTARNKITNSSYLIRYKSFIYNSIVGN